MLIEPEENGSYLALGVDLLARCGGGGGGGRIIPGRL